MYIGYDLKNGILYAKLYVSKRNGKSASKDYQNLGRVLDKEKGIYQSRERGVFTYDLQSGEYGSPPAFFVPQIADRRRKERLTLDFGDAFFLDSFIRSDGLRAAVDAIGYGNPDTLYSMICYYILCNMSNRHAADWWEGSYARMLYPKANLSSQRISDFLSSVGEEASYRSFFSKYLPCVSGEGAQNANIVIDSTGLPNNIHFPLTAISSHNGEISNEVRLIYVTQQSSGLPIYFRYCPGNVIDASTLIRTMAELKASGVNIKFAILDAGYFDEDNVQSLYDNGVSFVTRLPENRKLYKDLMAAHLPSMETAKNLVSYNDRYVYVKTVSCELKGGHKAYAHIGLDIERKASESRKLFRRAKATSLPDREVHERISKHGMFVLLSTRRIAKDKILPTYYTRQQIEQIFDIGKNYADMTPLRVQGEDTFRGHLILTFIASVIVKKIQDKLIATQYNPISLFSNLRNQKCRVYEHQVITCEAFKKANDCYKLFGIKCPEVIQLR